MQITNSIGWTTPWLRKLIRWIAKELEYDWRKLTAAHFCLAHRSDYMGLASLNRHAIRVKINPSNQYPLTSCEPRTLGPVTHADSVELLVRVTAHEIAHLERWDRFARELWRQGKRDALLERETEAMARMVLTAFRSRRHELFWPAGTTQGPALCPLRSCISSRAAAAERSGDPPDDCRTPVGDPAARASSAGPTPPRRRSFWPTRG